MRIPTNDMPVKIDAPGARACQKTEFGDAGPYGTMGAEHFRVDGGADLTPFLEGLEDDLCQSPHWGYLISGEVVARYTDGSEEPVHAGDLFYWPPGHTVRVTEDAEFVLFSPQNEHTPVLEHIREKMGAGAG